MSAVTEDGAGARPAKVKGPLIKRQSIWTRVTHWVWVICLFFLLLTGLQIFNAHPTLYLGQQSGFEFENSILSMHAERLPDGSIAGYTTLWGNKFDTTGLFGYSGPENRPQVRGFPAWMTIPSYQDLDRKSVV